MRYLSAHTVKFDSGHRYTVTITFEREGYPAETDLEAFQTAALAIDTLASELRDRDLAKMLGPHHPSVYGVAAFFMERMSIHYPIKEVRVSESDGPTAIIENDTDY